MANLQLGNSRKVQSKNYSSLSESPFFVSKRVFPENKTKEVKNQRRFAWKVASNIFVSFKYAWAGISYAFATQRNFRIHTFITVLVISLGFLFQVSTIEMSILALTCSLVMVLELLNTAIESVVDLTVKQTYHELAKIAKDCAAGAVLISAIAAVLVGVFILLPHGLDLIFSV